MKSLITNFRPGLVYALAVILAAAFQFNSQIIPNLMRPDYLLVLPLLAGLGYGPRDGLILGLVCGFFRDYMAGRYFGLAMLFTFLLSWGAGFLPIVRSKARFILYAVLITSVTVLLQFMQAFMSFFAQRSLDGSLPLGWFLLRTSETLPLQILMNILALAIILLLKLILPPYPRPSKPRSGVMINFEPGGTNA